MVNCTMAGWPRVPARVGPCDQRGVSVLFIPEAPAGRVGRKDEGSWRTLPTLCGRLPNRYGGCLRNTKARAKQTRVAPRPYTQLEIEVGRGIWEAYQHGAFREGSRFERSLGRMLANSDGPDRAEWESGESGGTHEKRLRLRASEEGYDDGGAMIAFDEEDPATVWCRLVWHRAWQLFAPEVGCYQGNEWIGNICGRVAKVLEAEAALVELETAGPLPQAAGTAKDQSTLVDDPDIPLSPAKLGSSRHTAG